MDNKLAEFVRRLLMLVRRRQFDADLDEEMRLHRELREQQQADAGSSPEEARYAVQRRFGNDLVLREESRDMWGWDWLENLLQDTRFGLRMLVRNPGFAAVAVLTLALGIGANTAIFSVVDAALLRPMPYPDPGRLTLLWGNVKRVRVERRGASYPDYQDWRDQSRSFTAMAAYSGNQFALTRLGEPERIPGEFVSQPYFSLLGIGAQLGRTFTAEEDQVPQRNAVAILS